MKHHSSKHLIKEILAASLWCHTDHYEKKRIVVTY